MTPLETLQKYNLKTDVKSIKYRVEMDSYFAEILPVLHIPSNEMLCDVGWGKLNHARNICRSADLSLLCSLAEKGEALETPKPVKVVQGGCGGTWKMPLCPSCGKDIQSANDFSFRHCPHCGQRLDWKHPITEAEGEGK